MRESVLLPPLKAILDLHAELLTAWGGAPGARDIGALEAALARPQHIPSYSASPTTVFDLTAALGAGSCRHHHPFVDASKRTAFAALGVVLGLNGWYLDVAERAAAERVTALAAGEMDERAFRNWVAANSFELGDLEPKYDALPATWTRYASATSRQEKPFGYVRTPSASSGDDTATAG